MEMSSLSIEKSCGTCKLDFSINRSPFILLCCSKQICIDCARLLESELENQACPFCKIEIEKATIQINNLALKAIAIEKLDEIIETLQSNHEKYLSIKNENYELILSYYASQVKSLENLKFIRKASYYKRQDQDKSFELYSLFNSELIGKSRQLKQSILKNNQVVHTDRDRILRLLEDNEYLETNLKIEPLTEEVLGQVYFELNLKEISEEEFLDKLLACREGLTESFERNFQMLKNYIDYLNCLYKELLRRFENKTRMNDKDLVKVIDPGYENEERFVKQFMGRKIDKTEKDQAVYLGRYLDLISKIDEKYENVIKKEAAKNPKINLTEELLKIETEFDLFKEYQFVDTHFNPKIEKEKFYRFFQSVIKNSSFENYKLRTNENKITDDTIKKDIKDYVGFLKNRKNFIRLAKFKRCQVLSFELKN